MIISIDGLNLTFYQKSIALLAVRAVDNVKPSPCYENYLL